MSIPAADSALFPEFAATLLLLIGTAISIVAVAAGYRRLRQLRPPPQDSVSTLSLILAGALGFMLVGTAAGGAWVRNITPDELRLQIASLIGTVAAVFGALLLNSLYRRDGLRRLGLSREFIQPGILSGVGWFVLIVPWILWTNLGVEAVMRRFHITSPTEHEIFQTWDSPAGKSIGFRIIAIVAAVVIAPFAEEILFRGLLQTLIVRLLHPMQRQPRPIQSESSALVSAQPEAFISRPNDFRRSLVAIVITAGLFASIHRPFAIQPAIFVLAVGLGLAYERKGNLWTSMTIHCLFNAANFAIFLVAR